MGSSTSFPDYIVVLLAASCGVNAQGARFNCPKLPGLHVTYPSPELERSLRSHLCWWPSEDVVASDDVASLEMALGRFVGPCPLRAKRALSPGDVDDIMYAYWCFDESNGEPVQPCVKPSRPPHESPYLQAPYCQVRDVNSGNSSEATLCRDFGNGVGLAPIVRDQLVHVNWRYRLAFIHNLKAAGRTWLRYLSALGGWTWTTLHTIWRNNSSPTLFYFAFVREPATRFFSGYQEGTRCQYLAPMDITRGRCPDRMHAPPYWYPFGKAGYQRCRAESRRLRHAKYARVPLSLDEDVMRLRFRNYVMHHVRTSGNGALLGESHTLSQVNFLAATHLDGTPWVPDFVGRMERLPLDAEELILKASERLPRPLAMSLLKKHQELFVMFHPQTRVDLAHLGSNQHKPMHQTVDFYLSAVASHRDVCYDFCKAVLQDSVCLGYDLPSICAKCGEAPRRESDLSSPRTHGPKWRRFHRQENCLFFLQHKDWGQQAPIYCNRLTWDEDAT